MALPNNPQTRKEMYLSNMAGQGTALPSEPHTREEEYLDYIAKNGGGGGGTGDGDMKKSVYDGDLAVAGAGGIKSYVTGAISGKVDKVQGKGLSSNDYDDSAKAIVDNVTTALDGKVSKSNTAGLVKNDGTIDTTITGAVSANTSAITGIKDGQSLDSFGDVETALAGKMPNYGIGTGLYVDSDTNQLRADAVTLAIKDSPKLITSGAVFSGLGSKYGTADQLETELDGQDKFPFSDFSASEKRQVTFGSIKAKLKEYFDLFYTNLVSSATNGNFAGLDANGNLTDSGQKASDFVAAVAGKGLSTNDYDDTEKAKVAAAFPRSEQAVLGAKNLLNHIATNQTLNGVTVTVDDDGIITLNGTSTADSYIGILTNSNLLSLLNKYGDLILNGTALETASIARMMTRYGGSHYVTDNGYGLTLYKNIAYDLGISLQIYSGQTFSNVKIKPMLRLASDPDDTYVPYAKTNKELTEKVTVITSEITTTGSANITLDDNIKQVYKYGKIAYVRVRFTLAASLGVGTGVLFKVPYKALATYPLFTISKRNAPFEIITDCSPYIDGVNVIILNYDLPAGTYDMNFSYVIDE